MQKLKELKMKENLLPKLGFGTASIALGSQMEAERTLKFALENGIRYFDTAPLYGGGQAEVRLGQALKDAPKNIMVSTKCGRYRDYGTAGPASSGLDDTWDYSEKTIRESINLSQDRLNREFLDIVYLHDIETSPKEAFEVGLPLLREMQTKGVVGAIGAGCNTVEGLLSAIEAGASDILLVAGRWTLLDRSAGRELLYKAELNGAHIVVGGLLNSGCLANPYKENTTFNYRPIKSNERTKLLELAEIANRENVSILAAATQFPARDKRIGTTLLGAATKEQLKNTLESIEAKVTESFWSSTKELGIS